MLAEGVPGRVVYGLGWWLFNLFCIPLNTDVSRVRGADLLVMPQSCKRIYDQ
jgi:hypothetical protein